MDRVNSVFGVLVFGFVLLSGCVMDGSIGDEGRAIVAGSIDGDDHPAVVLISMEVDGEPMDLCSGTLLSPTVVLTAGHCTGEPGDFSAIRVFTESDVENGNNNFPDAGPNSVDAVAWHSHPLYTNAEFFVHDVGVIELAKPVHLPPGASYGQLPPVDLLDGAMTGPQTWFTAVGYGVQKITGSSTTWDLIRMNATPYLQQIDTGYVEDYSLLLSNNETTGGLCYGDSGGPSYLGDSDVIAGVTSFIMNRSCAGTGGVFRLDRADVIDFVSSYL